MSSLKSFTACLCGAVLLIAASHGYAQQPAPDLIFTNGKIVTVDDRFNVAQAVAVTGGRIVAVGKNQDIAKLAGPTTRKIDLRGKAVIPGLIDNHAHFIRTAEYWDREVRWDGVTSRKQAVEMLRAKARAAKPGEWVLVLGGWSLDQFRDSHQEFTKDELDGIAPANPVLVQLIYFRVYSNSAALKALDIDDKTPDPRGGKIGRDASGKPTGIVDGAGGVAFVTGKLPEPEQEQWLANARKMVADLNRMGLTAWLDAGGRGMRAQHYEPFRYLAERGELDIRAFWLTIRQPGNPEQVDKVVAEIPTLTPFQGNDYFDNVGYGESLYNPVTDNLLDAEANPKPEDLAQMRRVATALAERGLFLNAHATLHGSIDAFLTEFEAINKVNPIKGLRWTFSHLDQVDEAQIERMRKLGMYAQIHSRPTIQGVLMRKVHGDKAIDMPPFRLVQDSGIPWGLGTDATVVTGSNPFFTLALAVTGKMIGGNEVVRQTVTREQALIAHTRANAYFVFREADLGSIQKGKYADMLVLDRDYLTVPADAIKDLKPLMTVVGGKIVYDAKRWQQ